MARENFIDDLRLASRLLIPFKVDSGRNAEMDTQLRSVLHAADLWLTPKSVEGFDPADFADWSQEDRETLENEVAAFRAIAEQVPANKAASKAQSKQARKHLEGAIKVVRHQLLHEWLEALEKMMHEAREAAQKEGWYVQKDEKDIRESLLDSYKAPRLRIRAEDKEVVLDPIARFGSGRQGVVDLVVMPTYETAYLVVFKDNNWQIVSPYGSAHRKPFTQRAFVKTVTKLFHSNATF